MPAKSDAGLQQPLSAERLAQLAGSPRLLHSLLEDRFPEMRGHWGWVALYASLTASRLGLGRREVKAVESAAGLMDLGMLWMDDGVRFCRGEPGAAEIEAIRCHPLEGEAALAVLRPGWD